MQNPQRIRKLGWALLVCGLFITSAMGLIIYNTAPTLLQPGANIDGTTFTGTAEQGRLFLGLFGVVAVFGIVGTLYGLWQIKTGRQNKMVALFLVGIVVFLWFAAISM